MNDAYRAGYENRARLLADATANLLTTPKKDGHHCVTVHDRGGLVAMLALMYLGVILQEHGIPIDTLPAEQEVKGGGS